VLDVGIGGGNIARLHRQHLLFGRAAEFLLQQCYDVQEFFRVIVADIVDLPRRRAARGIGFVTDPVAFATASYSRTNGTVCCSDSRA
jgi:hypothetical protein